MDDSLYFTEQHHQVREMVREFARTRVAPVARDLDRTQEFPWENIKTMGELGLLGVPWSEELGGAGMDQISYYVTLHELGKVDASHSLTISAHTNLGTSPTGGVRHRRGTEGALCPAAREREGDGRLRAHRAGRGQRCGRDRDRRR